MRNFFRCLPILLAFSSVQCGNAQMPSGTVPLTISKETTYLTEPLTPDGKHIDYGLYLERQFAPKNPRDNGFRDVVLALGREQLNSQMGPDNEDSITDEYWNFLCERLQVEPVIAPKIHVVHVSRAIRTALEAGTDKKVSAENVYRIHNQVLGNPWTGKEYPYLEKWLSDSEAYFNLLDEALCKPAYTLAYSRSKPGDPYREMGDFMSCLSVHRNFCRDLTVRTNYYIGTKQYDAAWQDILTIYRMLRAFQSMPDYMCFLTGQGMEQVAQRDVIRLIKSDGLQKEQWTRFAGEFERIPSTPSFKELNEIRRLDELAILCAIPGAGEDFWKDNAEALETDDAANRNLMDTFPMGKIFTILKHLAVDWNIMAKATNAYYDGLAGLDVPPQFGLEAYETANKEAESKLQYWQNMDVPERSRRLGLLYGYYWKKSYESSCEVFCRYRAQTDAIRIAFALGLFKAEYGKYPEKLEELVEKEIMSEVPLDVYRSEDAPVPFQYKLKESGGYMLYRLNRDGKNDGGDTPQSEFEERYPALMDDRRIDMEK